MQYYDHSILEYLRMLQLMESNKIHNITVSFHYMVDRYLSVVNLLFFVMVQFRWMEGGK
jgi:hypothetical protein